MEDAYAKSVAEVLEAFGVDRTKGLSDSQVEQHALLYGKNDVGQYEALAWMCGGLSFFAALGLAAIVNDKASKIPYELGKKLLERIRSILTMFVIPKTVF